MVRAGAGGAVAPADGVPLEYGGRRGGNWYNGWWGPAVAAGLVLGAAGAYRYYGGGYDACWQNRPVYSPCGAYLGYQMVNVCQ